MCSFFPIFEFVECIFIVNSKGLKITTVLAGPQTIVR